MPAEKTEHSLFPGRDRRVPALFVLGLATAAIGALDLVSWYVRDGEEFLFAAARRGPGGTTAALLCLLAVAFYLSRRKLWSLLVLPVVAHAALFIWLAGESMTFAGSISEHGRAIAESLTQWHLRVDLVTIILGIGISVTTLLLETRPSTVEE